MMRGRRASDGAQLRIGRPRQRLAGFGSRPLLNLRIMVGVRMDEELHLKWSSGSAAWGFDSSPYRRYGTVAKKKGRGPQNRHAPVRIRPVPPASWRNAARDPSKVQVRVRLPARLRFAN